MSTPTLDVSFPEKISNSQRSIFLNCPQQWFYRYCLNARQEVGKSIHLVAGASFATGLEAARRAFYEQGMDAESSIQSGYEALTKEYNEGIDPTDFDALSSPKALDRMQAALYSYFDQWPIATDYLQPMHFQDRSGIEFDFALPLPIMHPDKNQALLIEGRSDLIGRMTSNDTLWIVDDKTTSALGTTWRNQWQLDAQITTYTWAAQQYGFSVAGGIIRGTAILKRDIKHEEVLEPRSKFQIENWYAQFLRDVQSMIDCYRRFKGEGRQPDRMLDKSHCMQYARACDYIRACSSPEPLTWLTEMIKPRNVPELSMEDVDAILGG